jgi:hypothetical protein
VHDLINTEKASHIVRASGKRVTSVSDREVHDTTSRGDPYLKCVECSQLNGVYPENTSNDPPRQADIKKIAMLSKLIGLAHTRSNSESTEITNPVSLRPRRSEIGWNTTAYANPKRKEVLNAGAV